jgi:hypothetical protein
MKINRRSAMPKPAKAAAFKRPKPRAKWDDKAKQRIIDHFKRELSQSHGVKR